MPSPDHIRRLLRNPRGHELEIGLALTSLKKADLGRLGHASLTELVRSLIDEGDVDVDYSTLMRWCRAASVLDGPDDPMAALGVSKLLELARVSGSEGLPRFLRQHPLEELKASSVRELKVLVRRVGDRPRVSPGADEPHGVLERAISWRAMWRGTSTG